MKIAFIGCVKFSCAALSHLLAIKNHGIDIVGVVTRESSSSNADFVSLIPVAEKNNIPYFIAEKNDQPVMASWLKDIGPDVIYCFGWSYLLKEPVLRLPKLGVIGYHPAALPQNRGRHPIIWALALGLKETASTFFFMNEGADSGDILSQRFLPIPESDDAGTLYEKLTDIACGQISEFTPQLAAGNFTRIIQDNSLANYWRKRHRADGQIDWRMSARHIHNLVRALARPYAGAHFIYKGQEYKVWKTQLLDDDTGFSNVEPGKILEIKDRAVVVKCGDGRLKLTDYDYGIPLENGIYL